MQMGDAAAASDPAVQLAFITDEGAVRPTVLAMWSALRRASGPVRVIFVGIDLTDAQWDSIARVVAHFPTVDLTPVRFDKALLKDVASPSPYISDATYARLFLHRFTSGRVLYLDGDILVTGDVCRIAHADLGRNLIAATCDYVVQKWSHRLALRTGDVSHATKRIERIKVLTHPYPPSAYFNAGVVLMDMDRLKSDPARIAALEDVERAGTYPLADQDHLNRVFAGKVTVLGPEWNCSWRRLKRQRRFLRTCNIDPDQGSSSARPIIVHYHGPQKPWGRISWRHALRVVPLTLEYRYAQSGFLRDFPEYTS